MHRLAWSQAAGLLIGDEATKQWLLLEVDAGNLSSVVAEGKHQIQALICSYVTGVDQSGSRTETQSEGILPDLTESIVVFISVAVAISVTWTGQDGPCSEKDQKEERKEMALRKGCSHRSGSGCVCLQGQDSFYKVARFGRLQMLNSVSVGHLKTTNSPPSPLKTNRPRPELLA